MIGKRLQTRELPYWTFGHEEAQAFAEEDSMKKHLQPLTPAALYARVSSDRQDVDLSVSAQLRALRELRRAERLPRSPRVRGRGRERAHRRPAPVPKDAGRGRQAGGPLQGNPHPTDSIATENSGIRGRSD